MYLVSIVIGLIIVISAILLIRSELNRAIRSQTMLLEQSRVYKDADLFEILESLQGSVDEMNRAFYDIAGDLEGKYSVHEKEIELLNERTQMHLTKLSQQEKKIVELEKSINLPAKPVVVKSVKENIDQMNEVAEARQTKTEPQNPIQQNPSQQNPSQQNPSQQSDDPDSEILKKIIELRSQGKSLPQIAKELGIGMGELQLLITLKK